MRLMNWPVGCKKKRDLEIVLLIPPLFSSLIISSDLQLVRDLEQNLHMDTQIVKKCVGNVQNGLYELTEQEASLLASLESVVSTSPTTPTTPASSSLPFALSPVQRDDAPKEGTKEGCEEQGEQQDERKGGMRVRGAEGACWSRRC